MEDFVSNLVDEVTADDAELAKPDALLDVTCYVLNRTDPVYIVSGRGLAHMQMDETRRQQLTADVVARVHAGIRRVKQVRRPDAVPTPPKPKPPSGAYFNVPPITGRILNAADLRPATDVLVTLLRSGAVVTMMDGRWANPYTVSAATPGSFVFLPVPIAAPGKDAVDELSFELAVDGDGLLPLHHRFSVQVESSNDRQDSVDLGNSVQLGYLYCSPTAAKEIQ